MWKTVVQDGETMQALSARLGRPLCMILRANRLFSGAWLMPGREIDVPEEDFCLSDFFPCPSAAICLTPETRVMVRIQNGDTAQTIGNMVGLPPRSVKYHMDVRGGELPAGRTAVFPLAPPDWRMHTVQPGETVDNLVTGNDAYRVRSINGIWGRMYPGMKILIPPVGR